MKSSFLLRNSSNPTSQDVPTVTASGLASTNNTLVTRDLISLENGVEHIINVLGLNPDGSGSTSNSVITGEDISRDGIRIGPDGDTPTTGKGVVLKTTPDDPDQTGELWLNGEKVTTAPNITTVSSNVSDLFWDVKNNNNVKQLKATGPVKIGNDDILLTSDLTTDYVTTSEFNTRLDSEYYTKEKVNDLIANISGTPDVENISVKVSELNWDTSALAGKTIEQTAGVIKIGPNNAGTIKIGPNGNTPSGKGVVLSSSADGTGSVYVNGQQLTPSDYPLKASTYSKTEIDALLTGTSGGGGGGGGGGSTGSTTLSAKVSALVWDLGTGKDQLKASGPVTINGQNIQTEAEASNYYTITQFEDKLEEKLNEGSTAFSKSLKLSEMQWDLTQDGTPQLKSSGPVAIGDNNILTSEKLAEYTPTAELNDVISAKVSMLNWDLDSGNQLKATKPVTLAGENIATETFLNNNTSSLATKEAVNQIQDKLSTIEWDLGTNGSALKSEGKVTIGDAQSGLLYIGNTIRSENKTATLNVGQNATKGTIEVGIGTGSNKGHGSLVIGASTTANATGKLNIGVSDDVSKTVGALNVGTASSPDVRGGVTLKSEGGVITARIGPNAETSGGKGVAITTDSDGTGHLWLNGVEVAVSDAPSGNLANDTIEWSSSKLEGYDAGTFQMIKVGDGSEATLSVNDGIVISTDAQSAGSVSIDNTLMSASEDNKLILKSKDGNINGFSIGEGEGVNTVPVSYVIIGGNGSLGDIESKKYFQLVKIVDTKIYPIEESRISLDGKAVEKCILLRDNLILASTHPETAKNYSLFLISIEAERFNILNKMEVMYNGKLSGFPIPMFNVSESKAVVSKGDGLLVVNYNDNVLTIEREIDFPNLENACYCGVNNTIFICEKTGDKNIRIHSHLLTEDNVTTPPSADISTDGRIEINASAVIPNDNNAILVLTLTDDNSNKFLQLYELHASDTTSVTKRESLQINETDTFRGIYFKKDGSLYIITDNAVCIIYKLHPGDGTGFTKIQEYTDLLGRKGYVALYNNTLFGGTFVRGVSINLVGLYPFNVATTSPITETLNYAEVYVGYPEVVTLYKEEQTTLPSNNSLVMSYNKEASTSTINSKLKANLSLRANASSFNIGVKKQITTSEVEEIGYIVFYAGSYHTFRVNETTNTITKSNDETVFSTSDIATNALQRGVNNYIIGVEEAGTFYSIYNSIPGSTNVMSSVPIHEKITIESITNIPKFICKLDDTYAIILDYGNNATLINYMTMTSVGSPVALGFSPYTWQPFDTNTILCIHNHDPDALYKVAVTSKESGTISVTKLKDISSFGIISDFIRIFDDYYLIIGYGDSTMEYFYQFINIDDISQNSVTLKELQNLTYSINEVILVNDKYIMTTGSYNMKLAVVNDKNGTMTFKDTTVRDESNSSLLFNSINSNYMINTFPELTIVDTYNNGICIIKITNFETGEFQLSNVIKSEAENRHGSLRYVLPYQFYKEVDSAPISIAVDDSSKATLRINDLEVSSSISSIQSKIDSISSTVQASETITHEAPFTGSLSDYTIGCPVYATGVVKSFDFTANAWVNSTNSTNCISEVKPQGSPSEFIGILVSYVDTNGNHLHNLNTEEHNIRALLFASHGDFHVHVPLSEANDNIKYKPGDTLLLDGSVLSPSTTLTAKIKQSIIGTVTSVIDSNTVAVFRS